MMASRHGNRTEVLSAGDPAAGQNLVVIEPTFEYTAHMNAAGVESLLDQVRIGADHLGRPVADRRAVKRSTPATDWTSGRTRRSCWPELRGGRAVAGCRGSAGGQAERDRHLRAEAGQRRPGSGDDRHPDPSARRDRASGLEVALQLGFGAGRSDDDLDRLAGEQDRRRWAAGPRLPSARSTTVTGWPSSSAGGSGPEPGHGLGDQAEVGDPHRELVGLVAPRSVRAISSSRSATVSPAALSPAASVQHPDQGRDAVLVRHGLGVDAVADRLLVAERQAGHPADPLEAGQGVDERLRRARRPSPTAASWRRSSRRRCRVRRGAARRRRAARRARRRAASASAPSIGAATAQRSASGSLATTRSAPDPLGQRQGQVDGARLLRVREGDGREVRVGFGLLGARPPAAANPAGRDRPVDDRAADAVQRGVDPAAARAARRPGTSEASRSRYAVDQLVAQHPVGRRRAARRPVGARRPRRSGPAISASAGGTICEPSPR